MKRFTKYFAILITVLLVICLFACGDETSTTNSETTTQTTEGTTTESTTTETTAPETTLSAHELLMQENQTYLDSVTYLDFELTGEETPYYVGRWFEKNIGTATHMVTVSCGSHLYFMVDAASSLKINFTKITALETPYFSYSIDGADPVRQLITDPTVTLPDNGKHTIRIIADGMTENENKWQGEIGFALKSIELSEGGKLYGIKPREKVIFFYGDSITEGIRALNMNANSNGNSSTHAYPWYTAELLGAVPYFVGYGASGLVRPGSFNTMIDAIDYLAASREVDDSPYAAVTPDLIIVNHGTNDGLNGVSNTDYETALRAVISRLQTKYPGVKIVYMVPFLEVTDRSIRMQASTLDALAEEVEGLYIVHTKAWALSYTDGNLHPDAAGAKKAAEKLSAEIIDIVGEDFFQ